jgi:hypothetical protein
MTTDTARIRPHQLTQVIRAVIEDLDQYDIARTTQRQLTAVAGVLKDFLHQLGDHERIVDPFPRPPCHQATLGSVQQRRTGRLVVER